MSLLNDMNQAYQAVQSGLDGVGHVVGAANTIYNAYNSINDMYAGLGAKGPNGPPINWNPTNRKRSFEDPENRREAYREAESVASKMGGGSSSRRTPSTGVSYVPSQFIPGRGAELSYNTQNILRPIKFKSGESAGPKMVNAWERQLSQYKPQVVQHAFAFKMILVPPSTLQAADSLPLSRFYVHNNFRHLVGQASNTAVPTGSYGPNNSNWNESLGPDKSYVRKSVANGGSGYAQFPTVHGMTDAFVSPYRYPTSGGWMFSRLTRQNLENLGWNANPIKLSQISPGTSGFTASTSSLTVYSNAPLDDSGLCLRSMPNQIPRDSGSAGSTGDGYYYKSQLGVGNVSYNFSNDGSNPVVIDIVITRLKNNESTSALNDMITQYQQGYLNYCFANRGQANFAGETPQVVDVTTNARGPFLPAKALESLRVDPGSARSDLRYKQVGRDQFIIAGGASRNWSMNFEALNYDARKYLQTTNLLDDLSYTISIAVSGLPVPFIESSAGTATDPITAVIDKRGAGCNVSVTGFYREVAHPVYICKEFPMTFVNGNLDVPMFTQAGSITGSVDIASLGQATRGATLGSAYIALGPSNTTPGA